MEKTRQELFSTKAKSIDDFIATFESLTEMFNKWKKLGIKLIPDSSTGVEINARFTVPMGEILIQDTVTEVNLPEGNLKSLEA